MNRLLTVKVLFFIVLLSYLASCRKSIEGNKSAEKKSNLFTTVTVSTGAVPIPNAAAGNTLTITFSWQAGSFGANGAVTAQTGFGAGPNFKAALTQIPPVSIGAESMDIRAYNMLFAIEWYLPGSTTEYTTVFYTASGRIFENSNFKPTLTILQ